MCGMVADWLERSPCNAESTGSSLVRDSYLSKFFADNSSHTTTLQYYYTNEACKCTSELKCKKGDIKAQLYCIIIIVCQSFSLATLTAFVTDNKVLSIYNFHISKGTEKCFT